MNGFWNNRGKPRMRIWIRISIPLWSWIQIWIRNLYVDPDPGVIRNEKSKEKHYFIYNTYHFWQCCRSGSSRIRIQLTPLDFDPDPNSESKSGSTTRYFALTSMGWKVQLIGTIKILIYERSPGILSIKYNKSVWMFKFQTYRQNIFCSTFF